MVSVGITTGFLYQFGSGSVYDDDWDLVDVNLSLSSVPILFGAQSTYGSDIQLKINSAIGPVLSQVGACAYNTCASTNFEASLALLTDFGIKFDVNERTDFGISAGLLWLDMASDNSIISFMLSTSLAYDL